MSVVGSHNQMLYISCWWEVYLNGKLLDDERQYCIQSIEIEEQSDGSDTCSLQIVDPGFLFLDDNIFVEETVIKVVMGLHGGTYRLNFSGYISAIDITFPESGCPEMSVFCLDKTHLMNRSKKKRTWENTTSAAVVKAIAKEYGFKTIIQSGYTFEKQETISQSGNTDIEFLESLAKNEFYPFECKLVEDTIYYVKKGLLDKPVQTFWYKNFPYDIISFSTNIDKETRQEEIQKATVVSSSKKKESASATSENTKRDTQGKSIKTSASATQTSATKTSAEQIGKQLVTGIGGGTGGKS